MNEDICLYRARKLIYNIIFNFYENDYEEDIERFDLYIVEFLRNVVNYLASNNFLSESVKDNIRNYLMQARDYQDEKRKERIEFINNIIGIINSQIKDDKTSSMLFYIRDEREILIPLEMSNYDYKLELLKGHDFHLIYLKDDKIDVANLIYEDFDLENIKTHTLDFENTKVVKNFIKEQFDKNETFKNIYYTGYSYKEKLIIDAMLENNEEYIANIDEAKELLYTLTYSGMDCLTPTMDIYNDKSYDYNYTFTLDGSEPTPKKGTYDYDINKLLKTTEYNSIPDHPAGHFNLVNKDTRYFLGFEDKDSVAELSE